MVYMSADALKPSEPELPITELYNFNQLLETYQNAHAKKAF